MLSCLYAYICVHVHVSVGLFNAPRILAHHRHVGLRIFANTKESIARCLIPILDPQFVNASPSSLCFMETSWHRNSHAQEGRLQSNQFKETERATVCCSMC